MVFTSLREAAQYAGVTKAGIVYWAEQHGIGEVIDGRWHIDKEKLDAFLATRAEIARLRAELKSA